MIKKITTLTLSSAASTTGINVESYQQIYAVIKSASSASLTLKVQQSKIGTTTPDFSASASKTNPWTYVACFDEADPSTIIAGTTGFVYSGTDSVKHIIINVDTTRWLGFTVSGYSAGNVEIDILTID